MTSLSSKALKQIVKELQKLQQDPPEDIQVIANDENLTEIQAWIRGPDGTPYEGGYFKVKLVMDESFPDTPPKGYFTTKIFHPNVSPIGEICVNTLKKDWKPELGIEHVLLTIKCLLIVPNPESALNEEAGRLLLEHYEDYAKRARLYTSIQAKSGKNDFMALSKERLHNQENNPTTATLQVKSTATTTTTTTTNTTTTNTTTTNTTTTNTTTTESSTVLMPLSNTSPVVSPTMTGKKRLHEEQQENMDQKKQRVKKNDKKKTLRRL